MAAAKPTTTVTYTGAELTSYLLNGGSPKTAADTLGDSSTSSTPKKTAQLVAGTDFSKPFSLDAPSVASPTLTAASDTVAATSIAAAETTQTASPGNANSSNNAAGGPVRLHTPAIIGIVVGTAAFLAIIALIIFLLARHKRSKDRQRLHAPSSPSNEKFPPASPASKASGPTTPTRSDNPFHDDKADKTTAMKRTISNPRRKQQEVTASFDFGGLVPTKSNYGKDGKPIIAPTGWDERDVGRPFSLSRIPSPSSTIAVVGDETPIDYVGKNNKTPSPNKQQRTGTRSAESSPSDGKKIKRKLPPQHDRGLPISRPLSPFDDRNSIGSDAALRVIPMPGTGMKSLESRTSISSTGSGMSTRKPRPTPISVPPIHASDSRDSIIIDRSISPPMTLPPSIPTPPLPSMEFRKEWELLKRESTASVDSTDTNILNEVADIEETTTSTTSTSTTPNTVPAGAGVGNIIPSKNPLQPQTHSVNVQPLARNPSQKQIPRTVVIPPAATPTNPGEILKKEKTLLRVPSTASSLSSASTSSLTSNNSSTVAVANGQSGPNKRSPSIVAATAKWAEKRKALNAALAHQHNARANKEANAAPLPNNAAEKVEEARKSLQASPAIEENRVTPPLSPRKREVEGRSGVTNTAARTESVGSPTLSVFKCYDPERESTFVPGEALNLMRAMDMEDDKENAVPVQ